MAEIKNSESDMSTQQKAELDNSPCLRKWEMQSPME